MAKVIDITEKLGFEPAPVLKIKGMELTVNDSAETMLRLVDIMSKKGEFEAIMESVSLLFSEADRKKLGKLKLNFKDFAAVVESAIHLVTGEEDPGENPSRTTT
ncbi:MAG: hypothetical protein Q4F79_05650 [Eubacteriales bacterium]|nr:hypothetical protein [Eubacteriales bacterium]